jgi:branched-chain amino acid transport system permease protein
MVRSVFRPAFDQPVIRFLLRPRVLGLIALLAFLVVFPYLYRLPFFNSFLSDFRTFQATRFAIWLIIFLGLNLLIGYSGQISLGHAAFVTVGAYIAAILMKDAGLPVFLAVLGAALLTGLLGFLIGIPALRLSGPYLAIATLALIIVLPQIIKYDLIIGGHHFIAAQTGGVSGIRLSTSVVPKGLHQSLNMNTDQWLYYTCMASAVIMTAMAWSITRSRIGRGFIALRDSEIGASQMGINVSLYKMSAFGLSAMYAGTGGALYLFQMSYLGPTSFDISFSLTLVVMIVLGGLASVAGAIFASLFFTIRLDMTNLIFNHIPYGEKIGIDASRGAFFGLLLIIAIIFTPQGAAGNLRKQKEARPGGPRKSRLAALVRRIASRSRQKEAEASTD